MRKFLLTATAALALAFGPPASALDANDSDPLLLQYLEVQRERMPDLYPYPRGVKVGNFGILAIEILQSQISVRFIKDMCQYAPGGKLQIQYPEEDTLIFQHILCE